jgi:hypothetical protein
MCFNLQALGTRKRRGSSHFFFDSVCFPIDLFCPQARAIVGELLRLASFLDNLVKASLLVKTISLAKSPLHFPCKGDSI